MNIYLFGFGFPLEYTYHKIYIEENIPHKKQRDLKQKNVFLGFFKKKKKIHIH